MDTLLLIILGFIVGFYVGKILMRAQLTMAYILMLKDLGIKEADLLKLKERLGQDLLKEEQGQEPEEEMPVIRIKIEQHSNTLYAFRKDTDEFLGQAATAEDLIHCLGSKVKHARLLVSKEDGGDFMGGRSWEYDSETKIIK